MKEGNNKKGTYQVELLDEDFFENSEEWYVYYTVKNKETGKVVCEGVSMFEESFFAGSLEVASSIEKMACILSYMQEHVDLLLSKRNINTLHPDVKDLVMKSISSESGMYFLECYNQMDTDERNFYTQERLDVIRDEVEREGLSDYIEVGDLFMYEKRDGALVPSSEPVITVYMGVGTLFDLADTAEMTNEKEEKKVSLTEQIKTASSEKGESQASKSCIKERS